MIEPGTSAPDFTLPDQDGRPVSLADLRGRAVVLYFYPRAETPGCTTQACGVRDRRADYEARDAVVLGVSRDPIARLRAFADNHGLNFPLLSDEDHAVAEAYGTWVEKSMYGGKHMGMQRSTFVIDPAGRVAHVIAKVSPKTHDEQVLGVLDGMASAR